MPPGGATITYADLSAAVTAVRVNNHEPTGIVLSAGAAGELDGLAATDGQPLLALPAVAALPQYVSNVAGAEAYVGEWPQLVLAFRPQVGVRIRQVDAGLAEDFSVEIVAWQRMDVGLQDPRAFATLATGVTAASAEAPAEEPNATSKK